MCEEFRTVLSQVSIDQEEEKTGVEELGHKHSVSDRGEPLTVCVLTDPGNKLDDDDLQDGVEGNNDESNGETQNLRVLDVIKVLVADLDILLLGCR